MTEPGKKTRGGARRRTLLAAGAALAVLCVMASSTTAAPSYTGWSEPVNLGPVVNTTFCENSPALSPDGLSLYFESNRPGGSGGRDLWVSRRGMATAPWGAPVNLGTTINSSVDDRYPAFSADGHRLFFSSPRPGGFGDLDIYQSYRTDVHDDLGWQTPTNLGAGVNTALSDNGASYFENEGGAPQLFFGSGPQTGQFGERDLQMSELQADGTWGPPTWLPELSSVFTETRPTIRSDGLEIFFHRGTALGLSPTELWVATRNSAHDHWSAPVNLGPPVNTTSVEQAPYLSADGRTLLFDTNRPGGVGAGDIWMTTRSAKLTVSADHQTRLFGQGNPSLTSTISGFVGGETASVVSGAASCSTTATAASPAGSYPITCTVGSLSAAGYVFDSFVAGTLTVSYSGPCMTGPNAGPLHVAAGESVCIAAGGSQTGPVTVAPGGSLDVEGGRITGPVVVNGAAVVRICGAAITGPLTVSGSTGPVLVGGEGCDPNTVVGPVRITENTGGVEVNGNTVVGPLRVTGNAAPVHAAGNTVTGPVVIQP
jgi:hypothetical protein